MLTRFVVSVVTPTARSFHEALNLFTIAIEHDPSDARTYLLRAKAYGSLGKFAEAEVHMNENGLLF